MIKAILVDDEQDAIDILQTLLSEHCPDVKVMHTANNALEAVACIQREKPDMVFLDIQMPGYNGFDVLQNITLTEVSIVFTTAHRDYAITALRHGAFDYLLKPIALNELKACVERVKIKCGETSAQPLPVHYGIVELSVKEGCIFIKPSEIIRLEASGSYTVFYLDNKIRHVVSKGLKEYELQLDPKIFYRC